MSPSDEKNPERRSTGALILFGIGAGLAALAWFLGIGGVMTTVLAGGDPAMMAGGVGLLIALVLCTVLGVLLMTIGGFWMLAQVLADQTGSAEEQRYRNIER